jgi:hypothetical protein
MKLSQPRALPDGRIRHQEGRIMGRGILLWLLGVPLPVILILALLWH